MVSFGAVHSRETLVLKTYSRREQKMKRTKRCDRRLQIDSGMVDLDAEKFKETKETRRGRLLGPLTLPTPAC